MKKYTFSKISLTTLTVILLSMTVFCPPALTECGDIDGNGGVTDIADMLYLVDYMFLFGPSPPDLSDAEADGDGRLDISDLLCYVDYLYAGGPPPVCFPVHDDWASSCLDEFLSPVNNANTSECLELTDSLESMSIDIIGRNLYVYHENAYYNCCAYYIVDYSYEYRDDVLYITAVESDISSEPCDCNCYFNFESVYGLSNFEDGFIEVTLIDQHGDTVGTDREYYQHNGIVGAYSYAGDLFVVHYEATMNCCLDFYVDFTRVGNVITAQEVDSLNACRCLCAYNLQSVLHNLLPAEYTVIILGAYLPFDTLAVDTVTIE